jgi:RNA polymerase sigma-70 factor (ECF subfamily)
MCMTTDTTASLTDEQRMNAYVQGDTRAFTALFQAYGPMLFRYFVRQGKRPHDAQDLVQQTFLQLHRSRADYRIGEPLRPWLFTIARNVSHDLGRRQQRRPETCCDVDTYQAGEPTRESLIHAERTRALALALEQLPDEHRSLLNEHWFEDRSWTEIATRDGLHPGTLRVRAHRACIQLRAMIDNDHSEAACA